METYPQTLTAVTDRIALDPGPIYPDQDDDPEFLDFMQSITLSHEELLVFLARPDLSIAEVRQLFALRQDVAA